MTQPNTHKQKGSNVPISISNNLYRPLNLTLLALLLAWVLQAPATILAAEEPTPQIPGESIAAPSPSNEPVMVEIKKIQLGQKTKEVPRWPGQGDPKVEKARKCILRRESMGDYQIKSRNDRWYGAYQFNVKTSNVAARLMNRPELIGVPANQWSMEDQDAAFYLIFDNGKGRHHWFNTTKRCS